MKVCLKFAFLPFVSTSLVLALAGCSGATSFPDSSVNPAIVSPPLEGTVYGGHAPITGAQVYILTPSKTAYAGPGIAATPYPAPLNNPPPSNLSLSLMDGDAQNSGLTPTGTGNGLVYSANGSYNYHYVMTDSTGYFNLTGDYACTVDQAVYIVAVGGSAKYPSFTNSFAVKSVVVSNQNGSNGAETATYQFTVSQPPQEFYVGETITFSGFTTTANGQNFAGALPNGSVGTVTSISSQTPSVFTVTAPDPYNYVNIGSYNVKGVATANPTANPAIVNMAGLGLCPSTGNFSAASIHNFGTSDNGSIATIYMNEVSTTALAYAMAGFGTDAFHIGVIDSNTYGNSYAKNGMKQALYNAFNLYDITGSNLSTSNPSPGEGHIARKTTPGGNGTVPQATIDTLGNILAACVDSANTAAVASPNCQVLFLTATSSGQACQAGPTPSCPAGTTTPADIAEAAFNLAHYPAGVGNPTFVRQLYGLPQGEVPFTPNLAKQPNDFTVSLAFTAPFSSNSGGSLINAPQSIAIDAGNYVGNESTAASPQEGVWIGNFSSQLVKLFALTGVPDYSTNIAIAQNNTTNNSRGIAVDTSNNIWVAEQNAATLQEFTAAGSTSGLFSLSGYSLITGASWGTRGNLYTSDSGQNSVIETQSNGNSIYLKQAGCVTSNFDTAVDNNGIVYVLDANARTMCAINPTSQAATPQLYGFANAGTGYLGPVYFAVGQNNIVWAPGTTANTVSGAQLDAPGTSLVAAGTLSGGGLNGPCSVAVDGAGTIWVGNASNSSVSAFSAAGTALSPASTSTANSGGYAPLNQTSNCANPAIDRAGNVWIAYQGTTANGPNLVYEIIGAAAPTITPLAAAVANGAIGTLP